MDRRTVTPSSTQGTMGTTYDTMVYSLLTIRFYAWFGAGIALSEYRIATDVTVRGSNLVGAIFSAHAQTGPGVHLASCKMNTGFLSRV
jgi:hypothetical protein